MMSEFFFFFFSSVSLYYIVQRDNGIVSLVSSMKILFLHSLWRSSHVKMTMPFVEI